MHHFGDCCYGWFRILIVVPIATFKNLECMLIMLYPPCTVDLVFAHLQIEIKPNKPGGFWGGSDEMTWWTRDQWIVTCRNPMAGQLKLRQQSLRLILKYPKTPVRALAGIVVIAKWFHLFIPLRRAQFKNNSSQLWENHLVPVKSSSNWLW